MLLQGFQEELDLAVPVQLLALLVRVRIGSRSKLPDLCMVVCISILCNMGEVLVAVLWLCVVLLLQHRVQA